MPKVRKNLMIILLTGVFLLGVTGFSFAADVSLPPDALPASEQILYYPLKLESGTYMDYMQTIYNCLQGGSDFVQEPLMSFDKDLNAVPVGAESWEVSEDGLSWTFHLRKELKWSDGQPVTANDYVFALQRCAQQGYDFSWYWSLMIEIKNWDKVEKGELPVDELGIKALDDYTLVLTTEVSKPYLLGALVWLFPVPQHVVKQHGNEYATQAETMVSNGPFKVEEWVKGSHITLVKNPYYEGLWKPYLEKIVLKYGTFDPVTGFPAYLNNEIYRSDVNPGQLAYVRQNMPDELHSWPMFRIFYLSFDTTKPPFDDIRVRYAINHASNREELCSTVLKDLASPEYSLLVKGFPGYDDAEEAKESSKFDPELAKKLLAEAGYPDGKGFPELELWIRAEDQLMPWQKPAAEYIQAQLKENLGINIIPRIMEVKTFTDALNQRTHNFFLLAYQFDYVDPSNFMDLYLTGGRHAWSSDEYDELVRKADSLGEWEQRVEKYREAERILAKECPAVFLFQQQYSAAWKPFLKGEGLEPNKDGLSSWGDMWARYAVTHIYISKH